MCSVSGSAPLTIRWKINDRLVNINLRRDLGLLDDGSLRVCNVRVDRHTGKYRCEAENSFGSAYREVSITSTNPGEVYIWAVTPMKLTETQKFHMGFSKSYMFGSMWSYGCIFCWKIISKFLLSTGLWRFLSVTMCGKWRSLFEVPFLGIWNGAMSPFSCVTTHHDDLSFGNLGASWAAKVFQENDQDCLRGFPPFFVFSEPSLVRALRQLFPCPCFFLQWSLTYLETHRLCRVEQRRQSLHCPLTSKFEKKAVVVSAWFVRCREVPRRLLLGL